MLTDQQSKRTKPVQSPIDPTRRSVRLAKRSTIDRGTPNESNESDESMSPNRKRSASSFTPNSKRKGLTSDLVTVANEEIQSESKLRQQPRISPLGFKVPTYAVPRVPFKLNLRDPQQIQRILNDQNQRLQNPLAKRWCRFEYFYSTADDVYFSNNEFRELLYTIYPEQQTRKLSREVWKGIRRQIGVPKLMSAAFLKREREKLAHFRTNLLKLRLSTDDQGSCTPLAHLFPPLPEVGVQVLVLKPTDRELVLGTIQGFDEPSLRVIVKLEGSKEPCKMEEENIMVLHSSGKLAQVEKEGGLKTLAIAAAVSPCHNGDDQVLKAVVHSLSTKAKLIQKLKNMHDLAEKDVSLVDKTEYAQLLVKLEELGKKLSVELFKLRERQENSPYRSLPKRFL